MLKKIVCGALLGIFIMSIDSAQAAIPLKSIDDTFTAPHSAEFVHSIIDGHYKKAESLVAQGVDVNAIGVDDVSLLLWLFLADKYTNDRVTHLLKLGANPNYQRPTYLDSPIYVAVENGEPEILKTLLKFGGNPNLIGPGLGKVNWSLLMVAAIHMHDDVIDILLDAGADINWVDVKGFTVGMNAVASGRYDIAAHLLDRGLTTNLDIMLKGAQMTFVNNKMQPQKDKVIEMLKVKIDAQKNLKSK